MIVARNDSGLPFEVPSFIIKVRQFADEAATQQIAQTHSASERFNSWRARHPTLSGLCTIASLLECALPGAQYPYVVIGKFGLVTLVVFWSSNSVLRPFV